MELYWPLPTREGLRAELVAAYSAPGRGYHGVTHLAEVLRRLDELGALDDREVVLAAWFHDAVHDRADSDEELSAQLAEARLADEPGIDAVEVARLVRLTIDHRPGPGDYRGGLLCDADLGVLAAPPDRYAQYVADVRKEHPDLPESAFVAGRASILRNLLAKETLFHSDHARRHWEGIARANIARELSELAA